MTSECEAMNGECEAMLTDCFNRYTKLTEWEQDFIKIQSELVYEQPLAAKDIEVLENIWDRVTADGWYWSINTKYHNTYNILHR